MSFDQRHELRSEAPPKWLCRPSFVCSLQTVPQKPMIPHLCYKSIHNTLKQFCCSVTESSNMKSKSKDSCLAYLSVSATTRIQNLNTRRTDDGSSSNLNPNFDDSTK